MNIDEKILKRLESDSAEIDRILATENNGLGSLLKAGLKGAMRPWFILVNVLVLVNFVALIYLAYQFFTQPVDAQIFWGVLALFSFQFHIAAKSWLYNEMNRSSLTREIKRLEVAITELRKSSVTVD
ncbi:DUF6768 family protein [Pseudoalteromonas piratica]|uniref:Uncharacterized protein n=1 Tax=Pseudoalteromonas piratica TaxID=1348114 RepID=A0A0A7EEM6_9GAMM|nr:DUF6768 family protein [Pseudoalteromonas piratica]AIY64477.1 hypothetical protein OM33_04445 [Pseudoalteromonas piratica]